jgi:hypothetical protein
MKRARLGQRAALAAAVLGLAGCATFPTEYREPAALAAEARTTLNLRVYDRAWELVNEKYFDREFLGVDWVAMRGKYRTEAQAAPDDAALYLVLSTKKRLISILVWAFLYQFVDSISCDRITSYIYISA